MWKRKQYTTPAITQKTAPSQCCPAQDSFEGTLKPAPTPCNTIFSHCSHGGADQCDTPDHQGLSNRWRLRPVHPGSATGSPQAVSDGVPEALLVNDVNLSAASALLATFSALVTSGWQQSCGCSSGSTQLLCGVGGTLA